ncbi:Monogalactosyldiacylglycerol synthase [Paenibacillus vortex V453]|jgi:processive 1,2-diacylglycerol beta-glucosyltransferase|uniref:Monogalactosyldiacylglycerol synthase n=1 Tax=Paenibacillus vortex V453 TaxID=715225 RepID=A0A2R9SQK7_9BACL|nr:MULTISPECIES: glycosyltransferase [Paenibacillus]ANA82747.1 galactosyldiacylglycerol synthase [Paenibacillus glucanolyticus]AVV58171.1 galactosyldiacylglycerol synthase [Paenibacillus glucanolyticus]EFU39649.1 Monogalactosyldiacylglycerol synthase [Paenibacillus vortex V453]ETT42926.1 Monogalactosyldiacylglycerol synthase [Paenibacillus sp. FSL R5-808]MPY17753.1 galactosyldiacylglycerol synthase [Paenibacillus glucanolyticus]
MRSINEQKILILTGSLGEGHNQASKAIVESAKKNYPHLRVKVMDYMELTHPRLHVAGQYFFVQWMKHFPSVYGYLFQKTREENTLIQMLKRFSTFSLHKLSTMLETEKPAIVVSTFPPAAAGMSLLKAMGFTDVPTATVMTDHTDHSYWIHSHTDYYMVGSDVVQLALERKGVPSKKISVTGIPVNPLYSQPVDQGRLRDHYGIHASEQVVLIMGGGEGMIDKEVIEWMKSREYPQNVRFMIVCGRNTKLYQSLQEDFSDHSQITVMGYVDRMHELMAMADLMVTKPGGLTISEALTMERPMLLVKPLPGQEQDNADYLVGIGVAQQAMAGELKQQLLKLITTPALLQEMKHKAAINTHKDSALSVLTRLLHIQQSYRLREWSDDITAVPYGVLNREVFENEALHHYYDSYR